jgi:hypothetical protein
MDRIICALKRKEYKQPFHGRAPHLQISKPENVVKYIKECREMGIAVEPLDVIISLAGFTPSSTGICFGLTAIKNVGHNAIHAIIAAREETKSGFSGFQEFCEKVDQRLMNKRTNVCSNRSSRRELSTALATARSSWPWPIARSACRATWTLRRPSRSLRERQRSQKPRRPAQQFLPAQSG